MIDEVVVKQDPGRWAVEVSPLRFDTEKSELRFVLEIFPEKYPQMNYQLHNLIQFCRNLLDFHTPDKYEVDKDKIYVAEKPKLSPSFNKFDVLVVFRILQPIEYWIENNSSSNLIEKL